MIFLPRCAGRLATGRRRAAPGVLKAPTTAERPARQVQVVIPGADADHVAAVAPLLPFPAAADEQLAEARPPGRFQPDFHLENRRGRRPPRGGAADGGRTRGRAGKEDAAEYALVGRRAAGPEIGLAHEPGRPEVDEGGTPEAPEN